MLPLEKLKQEVTLGQLIGFFLALAATGLMWWKTTDQRLTALEIRMEAREKQDERISLKLDKLQDGINDVKLIVVNKQDRK